MTNEDITTLKNDVNKLLEIYNADKPINSDELLILKKSNPQHAK